MFVCFSNVSQLKKYLLSQSGAIRVYSVWHAWVLLKSTGWRGTTLDLSPAGKLSCEPVISCEMDSLRLIQHSRDKTDVSRPNNKSKDGKKWRVECNRLNLWGKQWSFVPFISCLFIQWSTGCKSSSRLQIMCEHEWSPLGTRTQLVLMQRWDHGTSLGRLWKGCALWRSAASLCGWEHTPVSSETRKQPYHTGIRRSDPVARDAVVQRRLSAEPRTPFLHQMYF